MGKHEVGTPKYIANKIKAKGLQKLRWYCQMCQKQCRDENGFKCHTMSESHQRQLLLFAENPDKYIDSFSKEFEDGYLDLLRRRFGTKRVNANQVYQEYITDRNHLHMNATQWETLTEFVKWLGREGKCVVDQTEKGWYITYIEKDPESIAWQAAMKKKEKVDKDDQEKLMDFIDMQIKRGEEQGKEEGPLYTELNRETEDDIIKISLKPSSSSKKEVLPTPNPFKEPLKNKGKKDEVVKAEKKEEVVKAEKKEEKGEKRKSSVLGDMMKEEEQKKEKMNRKDYWLTEGIVVKVVTKSLGDKYYKKKGVLKEVIDKYVGVVKMVDTGHTLKLDQAHLETVIPAEGRLVKVLNGAYRGCQAVLRSLDVDNFCVSIQIDSGPLKGRVVERVKYEDISKLYVPS